MRLALILPILAAPAFAQPPARGAAPAGQDYLARCSTLPVCAAILKPFEAREVATLSDSARLVSAIIQSTAAMAALRNDHDKIIAGAGYCFKTRTPGDSTIVAVAVAPMQARLPGVRWCRSDEALPNPPRRGRVLPVPGTVVVGLSASTITVTGDSATTRFVIGSTQYQCRVLRQTGIWRVEACTLLGGS